jgi:hypothetical protein
VLTNDVIAVHDSIQRLSYQTRTTNYSTTATTVGSAANVFSTSLSFTADGTSSYLFEFWAVCGIPAVSDLLSVFLYDVGASADVGQVLTITSPSVSLRLPFHIRLYYTPTAGAKTFNFRATHSVASCQISGGAGGAGANSPMWAAVYGPPLA